jgi:hypothetical protein
MTTAAGKRTVSGSMTGGMKGTQEMMDLCIKHNIELVSMGQIYEVLARLARNDVCYRFVSNIGGNSKLFSRRTPPVPSLCLSIIAHQLSVWSIYSHITPLVVVQSLYHSIMGTTYAGATQGRGSKYILFII